MATTTKFYRLRGRNVRIATQEQTLLGGMYLTDQVVPETYAKIMVNYDIDDTGSCIKTRKGRLLHTTIPYEGYHKLGRMHITDYIYTYNEENTEVEDIKDVLLSYGTYGKIRDYMEGNNIEIPEAQDVPMFISDIKLNIDNAVYDEQGEVIIPGDVTVKETEDIWGLYCNKGAEEFHKIKNENIGYVSARTIKNAYIFDKKVANDLGYPIGTVLSNEIYAFSGSKIEANVCPSNESRNSFSNLGNLSLTKFKIRNTNEGYTIRREALTPREINPTQAQDTGYNMLSDSPYVLSDESGGAPRVLGILAYSPTHNDIPIFKYDVGTQYTFRVYYQYQNANLTYQYKLEVAENTGATPTYSTVVDWTNFTTPAAIYINTTIPYLNTLFRVTVRVENQTNTESVLVHPFECNSTYADVEPREFNLRTAKGMFSWFGSIGLYGVKDAADTIFLSDVEDPSYFPYPNNTITFDNEILAVHNYLDMLLVITTDSIILVQAGTTYNLSTQKKVMTNIFIPEVDAMSAVILKDQIFFKTDTQFYVLKPNKYTSDATDLKNFTNSTAIANYTINFTKETLYILNRVFRPITNEESKLRRKTVHFTDFDVINIESTVKNEEVHYVYTIVPYIEEKSFGNLDLHLVYNTISRSYRLYLQGIGDDNVSYTAKLYRNKQSGAFYEVIPYNLESSANILVVKESLNGRDDNIIQDDWQLTPYYNNYNYFDTGNVALSDIPNKRFRELQMNIINREDSKIRFYTDVKIDGKVNVTSTRYEIEQVTDPDDPDYGLVYVVPTEVDDLDTMMTAYGNTALECEDTELTKYWEIDLSAFPKLDIATIKLKLWGKGRHAAFQVLCTDLKNYELSTFTWVYRIMNVR